MLKFWCRLVNLTTSYKRKQKGMFFSEHSVHFRGLLPYNGIFSTCKIHFASKFCFILYWQRYCTTLEQWASAKVSGMVQGMELRNFCRGRHLYSAGWPSHWASAHILVMAALCNRGPLCFCPVISIFYRLLSFFSSPNLSGRRLDVYHTLTHGVALVRI